MQFTVSGIIGLTADNKFIIHPACVANFLILKKITTSNRTKIC